MKRVVKADDARIRAATPEGFAGTMNQLVSLSESLGDLKNLADRVNKLSALESRVATLEKRHDSLWKSVENLHSITQRIETVHVELQRYVSRHPKEHDQLDAKMERHSQDSVKLAQNVLAQVSQIYDSVSKAVVDMKKDITVNVPDIQIPEISVAQSASDENPKEWQFDVQRDSRGLIKGVAAKES